MTGPTSTHRSTYRPATSGGSDDGRLLSPVFPRNAPPLIAALTPLFEGRHGPVLEIGAGTGQHAGAFALAFPHLDWWPSDPDPVHRASIAAWASELRAPQRAPRNIDAGQDWKGAVADLGALTAVISLNVVHITPEAVLHGILAGAAGTLAADGMLIFYGPFKEDGAHTGPGNLSFDDSLRAENPAWGLRDISDIARDAANLGFAVPQIREMPANNRLVVLRRRPERPYPENSSVAPT